MGVTKLSLQPPERNPGNRLRDRVPTVSVTHAEKRSTELARGLAERGINAWSGHNYAYASAQQLGLDMEDGVLRLGAAHYNSLEEIEATLTALREIC